MKFRTRQLVSKSRLDAEEEAALREEGAQEARCATGAPAFEFESELDAPLVMEDQLTQRWRDLDTEGLFPKPEEDEADLSNQQKLFIHVIVCS